MGYTISLYYFWLPSADVSKERVAVRVSRGGHSIPPDVIERRYKRSIANLANLYIPVCEHTTIFTNAGIVPELVAINGIDGELTVLNENIWKIIVNYGSKQNEADTK